MKIVVIGASGNLGTAVLRRLSGTEHEVVAVARRVPAGRDGAARWVGRDVSKEGLDDLAEGADALVNLAWLLQPSHRPDVTWANNVAVAERVLAAARSHEVPTVVVASSVAAYSPRHTAEDTDEEWPTHGGSSAAYAREKAYIERMLDAFEAAVPGCRVVRLRPAFVFQRGAATEQRRLFLGPLVPGSVLRAELVPRLPVPRGLLLQAVHADDVAQAIVLAIESEAHGAYNLAGPGVLDDAALASIFDARPIAVPPAIVRGALAVAWHGRLTPAPPDLFDALMALPVMSTRRAVERLGWQPAVSAEEAVRELLDGLRAGADDDTPPLRSRTSGALRSHEFGTGVGERP